MRLHGKALACALALLPAATLAARPDPPTRTPARVAAAVSPSPLPAAPRPAELVPDQPFFGTPAAGEKPYAEILRLKQAGMSDKNLLAKVRGESLQYSLTTAEIQKLRAAKVPSAVIEAMLKSGRTATPPAPTRAPTPR